MTAFPPFFFFSFLFLLDELLLLVEMERRRNGGAAGLKVADGGSSSSSSVFLPFLCLSVLVPSFSLNFPFSFFNLQTFFALLSFFLSSPVFIGKNREGRGSGDHCAVAP